MLFKLFVLTFGLLVLLRMGCLLSPAMSRWICRRTARVFSFAFLVEGVKLYWFDGRFCCHRSPTALTGNLLTEKSFAHIAVRVYNRLHIIDLAVACPSRFFCFFFVLFSFLFCFFVVVFCFVLFFRFLFCREDSQLNSDVLETPTVSSILSDVNVNCYTLKLKISKWYAKDLDQLLKMSTVQSSLHSWLNLINQLTSLVVFGNWSRALLINRYEVAASWAVRSLP